MLTLDDIKQELRTFVRAHSQTLIDASTAEGRVALLNAWNDYFVNLNINSELAKPLQSLDISSKLQQDFIQQLKHKYATQFDLSFEQYILKRFQLHTNEAGQVDDAHAINFAGETALEDLLSPPKRENQPAESSSSTRQAIGFFNQSNNSQSTLSTQESEENNLRQ